MTDRTELNTYIESMHNNDSIEAKFESIIANVIMDKIELAQKISKMYFDGDKNATLEIFKSLQSTASQKSDLKTNLILEAMRLDSSNLNTTYPFDLK